MKIEFDARKAAGNLKKHGISFDEAAACLLDPMALAHEDGDAKGDERWMLLGMSDRRVCWSRCTLSAASRSADVSARSIPVFLQEF